ncbi:hypothetical protein QBC34DRAFT_421811 [Podospora aff. communis PSN243]|uniref:Uncharacterized protein n=1 Tax=Podospora aff. communis PSN243 TaxID=3040156 RepID=A0AAV9H0X8_9PEZI|nr:hypothetical protein QBC34DRAFT_421811 [Podospora aff. communis PSN243]
MFEVFPLGRRGLEKEAAEWLKVLDSAPAPGGRGLQRCHDGSCGTGDGSTAEAGIRQPRFLGKQVEETADTRAQVTPPLPEDIGAEDKAAVKREGGGDQHPKSWCDRFVTSQPAETGASPALEEGFRAHRSGEENRARVGVQNNGVATMGGRISPPPGASDGSLYSSALSGLLKNVEVAGAALIAAIVSLWEPVGDFVPQTRTAILKSPRFPRSFTAVHIGLDTAAGGPGAGRFLHVFQSSEGEKQTSQMKRRNGTTITLVLQGAGWRGFETDEDPATCRHPPGTGDESSSGGRPATTREAFEGWTSWRQNGKAGIDGKCHPSAQRAKMGKGDHRWPGEEGARATTSTTWKSCRLAVGCQPRSQPFPIDTTSPQRQETVGTDTNSPGDLPILLMAE